MNIRTIVVAALGAAALCSVAVSFAASPPPPATQDEHHDRGGTRERPSRFQPAHADDGPARGAPGSNGDAAGRDHRVGPTLARFSRRPASSSSRPARTTSFTTGSRPRASTGSGAVISDGELDPLFGNNAAIVSASRKRRSAYGPAARRSQRRYRRTRCPERVRHHRGTCAAAASPEREQPGLHTHSGHAACDASGCRRVGADQRRCLEPGGRRHVGSAEEHAAGQPDQHVQAGQHTEHTGRDGPDPSTTRSRRPSRSSRPSRATTRVSTSRRRRPRTVRPRWSPGTSSILPATTRRTCSRSGSRRWHRPCSRSISSYRLTARTPGAAPDDAG